MASARFLRILGPAALAAAALGTAASAQDVEGVDVRAPAPTEVRIDLRGKDHAQVRQEVRVAANYVCRNAVRNDELQTADLGWCAQRSSVKAMKRYRALSGEAALAELGGGAPGAIVLTAR